jgi:SAM-dependent methyltransferase
MTKDWFPNEAATAGAEHLDAAYVAAYDRKSATDPAEDVRRLLALGIDANATVVDMGAGTGAFAAAMAPHCRHVVAVDISSTMIEAIAARALGNVDVVLGGFLTYAHAGDAADAVYSRNALHHLPDFWKAVALQRIADMLRPGGTFLLRDLVYSFEPKEAEGAIDAWLARAADDPAVGWTREELAVHVRDEHSTFDWLLRPILERVGFHVEDSEFSPSRAYAMYLCR